ncbi:MAG: signal peptidase I [Candidatus Omnitrophica bacterium CG11_big_fil_rev_8_21_14_0_20_45_26]|uniref:Signal peptidase I n=1 Tax=Candidatus Abzuiibacterium crystallinum TaxID=1974748 RepID=A0A2H0LPN1_9BACT|nr:MAG: signal peptidase I [Candidatus Omnitrophica bacterium CG11_big_fil_rev_8_21_14_0_20_45_26]PIW64331.1 MAG: signal peptidase I [Candidatus Omnitrophica bacterium CG12_big_fil_rev_8_21_14_0_65_45_16]
MTIYIPVIIIAILIIYRRTIWNDLVFLKQDPKAWTFHKWKEWGEPFVVAVILAVIIRTFIIGPYKIPTGSMRPTLIEGDRIFVEKVTYRFHDMKRGDVIVFKYPLDSKKDFVKRLIAFGGEEAKIKDGQVYINDVLIDSNESIQKNYYYNRNDWQYGKEGMAIRVPDDSLFVLGDNSAHSSDSRNWGFVKKRDVIGRAVVIWWPPNRIGKIH